MPSYYYLIHPLEYSLWHSIKARCHNPNCLQFHNYGGRGISVCKRWLKSFEAFLQDVGKKPSAKHELDRRDNDGNYEPGNVRWVLRFENCRNTRRSVWVHRPRIIELYKQGMSQYQLAEEYGVNQSTICRIICGKIRSAESRRGERRA